MGNTMKLEVAYFGDTDTLSLWNGKPASEAGDVTVSLIADYDAEGMIVGFTLEHAAELLLNPLLSMGVDFGYSEVGTISSQESHTSELSEGNLTLKNLATVAYSKEVAEHLTAHYDADGDAAGFTLKRAAELLLPHLQGERASQRIPASASFMENDD